MVMEPPVRNQLTRKSLLKIEYGILLRDLCGNGHEWTLQDLVWKPKSIVTRMRAKVNTINNVIVTDGLILSLRAKLLQYTGNICDF